MPLSSPLVVLDAIAFVERPRPGCPGPPPKAVLEARLVLHHGWYWLAHPLKKNAAIQKIRHNHLWIIIDAQREAGHFAHPTSVLAPPRDDPEGMLKAHPRRIAAKNSGNQRSGIGRPPGQGACQIDFPPLLSHHSIYCVSLTSDCYRL
jgi:hypothetical protein